MSKPRTRAGWGGGNPDDKSAHVIITAMANDPDILKIEFVRFVQNGYQGWDFNIETVEGVDALLKLRFYWEEFLGVDK